MYPQIRVVITIGNNINLSLIIRTLLSPSWVQITIY